MDTVDKLIASNSNLNVALGFLEKLVKEQESVKKDLELAIERAEKNHQKKKRYLISKHLEDMKKAKEVLIKKTMALRSGHEANMQDLKLKLCRELLEELGLEQSKEEDTQRTVLKRRRRKLSNRTQEEQEVSSREVPITHYRHGVPVDYAYLTMGYHSSWVGLASEIFECWRLVTGDPNSRIVTPIKCWPGCRVTFMAADGVVLSPSKDSFDVVRGRLTLVRLDDDE